jgi:transcriptional regulator with XRE-family HTH domain
VAKVGQITEHERFRRVRRVSVMDQARGTGYSHSYVSQVETGKLRPSGAYRAAASRFLDVPEDLLFPEAERV